jgi:hypothetical protein
MQSQAHLQAAVMPMRLRNGLAQSVLPAAISINRDGKNLALSRHQAWRGNARTRRTNGFRAEQKESD